MTAGSLSLSYSAPGTFTATVAVPPGFAVQSVTLYSPSNSPMAMFSSTNGWTCTAGGGPSGAQPGTWTATATLMATAQCSGSVTV
jgi:hypothetical protein